MLVGRGAEQRSLDQMLSAARVGRSGVLLLTGEPGIGKTSLLEHAATHADGMRVLRAIGTRSERGIAFGGLLQLLRPALDLLEQLPGPQADALGAALALRRGSVGDRFAIGAATLGLLSRCAEDRPVLLLVDDAHELDEPSADALVFAVRRLVTDPVAVLAAARSEAVEGPLAALPTLTLVGLDLADAATLCATRPGAPPAPETVLRLHRATGGNPLALLELADDTTGLERLSPEVPVPVPEVLAGSFTRRLAQLGQATRTLLLLAVLCDGDLVTVTAAASLLGADPAGLADAEDTGLVTVDAGSVRFRHPMVRSSVYAAAPTAVRHAAHRAVAECLPPADLERRTWHRAEGAVGFDAGLADDLEAVALAARDRRAFAVAATAHERAALLTSDPERRAARLVAAGESAWWAGQVGRARALLHRGAVATEDVLLRTTADGLRGSIEAHTGAVDEARELLVRAAGEVSHVDADAAVGLLADATEACFWLGDVRGALGIAGDLQALASRSLTEESEVLADLATGMALVLAGRPGIGAIRRAVARLADSAAWPDDPLRMHLCLMGVLFVRERGTGRDVIGRVEDQLRSRGALGALPGLLCHTARAEATSDRWQSASTKYEESITLARETGESTHLAMSLAGLAWLHARTGDEESCRALVAEALALARRHHIGAAELWARSAIGDLELGLGRVGAAVAHYEELVARLEATGNLDVDVVPGPELVESLVRLDRHAEARRTAHDYHARAEAKGQPWARARAERALAMVADRDEPELRFNAALELHRLDPDLFEEARTRLAYAGWLRRGRRRVVARPLLRSALAAFDEIGAAPWAELAAGELQACGETPTRRGDSPLRTLTGQELQVARMLAAGRTTREAAAALFLSPKTVEYHLRHVYTKLDIHTRTELASALRDAPAG